MKSRKKTDKRLKMEKILLLLWKKYEGDGINKVEYSDAELWVLYRKNIL